MKKIMKALGKRGANAMGVATSLVFLVFASVIVQQVITNQTAEGNITGLSGTIAPFVVPMLWLGGLIVALRVARQS